MSLENIVTELGPNLVFMLSGYLADTASTYIFAKRDGIGRELNIKVREGMRSEGILKHLSKSYVKKSLLGTAVAGGFYALDYQLGNSADLFSGHNLVCTVAGTISYMASASNLLVTFGYNKTARIVRFPLSTLTKIQNTFYRTIRGKDIYGKDK